MERSMYTDHERRVTSERSKKYRGIALISLSQIVPHSSICRALDPRNVDRLCEVFSKEGCRRLDVPNHVTAVVSSDSLDAALQKSRTSAAQLMSDTSDEYPHLQFSSGQVKCLHGQHRLKAGEEFLADCDQWWTVNLYSDDISPSLKATLIDEYCNEKTPTDGEIYRKIRQYQHEANAHFEKRWKARLSPNKLKRLQQLESHDDVRAAVNSLLALPALLEQGMKICSISRALAIGCDEELVHGLNDLYDYWASLVKHKRSKMLKIDPHSIQLLQLLAPGVSNKDRKLAKGLVFGGEAFSGFTSAERASIWKKMKSRKRIIPSLYTFFQNVWYLESSANCLKRLVSLNKFQPTVKRAMRNAFSQPPSEGGDCLVQMSETKFQHCKSLRIDLAELAYRQIWLYAMRHYPKMAKEPENQDQVVKGWEKADPRVLYDLAVLARKLGYQSDQIKALLKHSPDRQIAREALLKARNHVKYKYDNDVFDSLVDRVAECFEQASPLDCDPERGLIDDRETKVRFRCGNPQAKAQRQDRWFLFVDQLHTAWPSTTKKVSTLFVRQCVYYTFFNQLEFSPPGVEDQRPMSPLFVTEESSEANTRSSKEEISQSRAYSRAIDRKKLRKTNRRGCRRETRERQNPQGNKQRRREHKSRKHQLPRSHQEPLKWRASENSPARISSAHDSSSGMDRSSHLGEEEACRVDYSERLQQSSELGTNDDTKMSDDTGTGSAGDPNYEYPADDLMSVENAHEQVQNTRSQSLASTAAEQHIPGEHLEWSNQREEEMTTNDAYEHANVEQTGELESTEVVPQQVGSPSAHMLSRTKSVVRPGSRSDAKWSPYDMTQRKKQEKPFITEQPHEVLERQIDKLLQPSEVSNRERPIRPVTQVDFTEMSFEPPRASQNQEEAGLTDGQDQGASTQSQTPWDATVTTSADIFDPGSGDNEEFRESTGNGDNYSTQAVEPSTVQTTTENIPANEANPVRDDQTNLSENLTSAPTSPESPTDPKSQIPTQVGQKSKRNGVIFVHPESKQPPADDIPGNTSPEIQAAPVEFRARDDHEPPTSTTLTDQTVERHAIGEQLPISENVVASQYNSKAGESLQNDITAAAHIPKRRRDETLQPTGISGASDHMMVDGPSGRKRGILFGHRRPRKEVKKPRAITQIDFTNWSDVATSQGDSGDPDEANAMPKGSLAPKRGYDTNQSTRSNDMDIDDSEKIYLARAEQPEAQTVDYEPQRGENQKVRIVFRGRDGWGGWDHVINQITVDPSDPGPVEIFAKEKAREQVPATFYDQNLRTIVPAQCFDAAVQDGTNTIFVAFGHEVARNEENMDSVSRALAGGSDQSVPDDVASL
ncbi:hypothetical protein N7499_006279 [Penicillium canescens]|nr:hypothetical protein N7499_006279 [Penicillium canescens]KAJ6176798.1 hypothetical protein N7485_003712 [Penicillium canescens]